MSGFSGFPAGTATFLQGITEHNDKAWFDAHRDAYEANYVAPANALVTAIGPRLREISPDVAFEPKVNGRSTASIVMSASPKTSGPTGTISTSGSGTVLTGAPPPRASSFACIRTV